MATGVVVTGDQTMIGSSSKSVEFWYLLVVWKCIFHRGLSAFSMAHAHPHATSCSPLERNIRWLAFGLCMSLQIPLHVRLSRVTWSYTIISENSSRGRRVLHKFPSDPIWGHPETVFSSSEQLWFRPPCRLAPRCRRSPGHHQTGTTLARRKGRQTPRVPV